VLAYKNDSLILSKAQGGEWGLANLDPKYSGLIKAALDCYASNKIMTIDSGLALDFNVSNNTMTADSDLALDFCGYMIGQIDA
jgi:hypothetical protein